MEFCAAWLRLSSRIVPLTLLKPSLTLHSIPNDWLFASSRCKCWLRPRPKESWEQSPARFTAKRDRKSTRLNSSHRTISYAVFCLKKKKKKKNQHKHEKNKVKPHTVSYLAS